MDQLSKNDKPGTAFNLGNKFENFNNILATTLDGEVVNTEEVSSELFFIIKNIEESIKGKKSEINEIENRGFFKTLFASSKNDVISLSKSQNEINMYLLQLIQEVITLNVMSYSFLVSVMSEFNHKVANGFEDSHGKFHQLGEKGKEFADTATGIFSKIIEGSKNTQERITFNTNTLNTLQENFCFTAEQVSQNKAQIEEKKRIILENSSKINLNSQNIAKNTELLVSISNWRAETNNTISEHSKTIKDLEFSLDLHKASGSKFLKYMALLLIFNLSLTAFLVFKMFFSQ